jgi:hypothetical protein
LTQGASSRPVTYVDSLAAEAPKLGGDLCVDRQLHAQLRLAHAGHAA